MNTTRLLTCLFALSATTMFGGSNSDCGPSEQAKVTHMKKMPANWSLYISDRCPYCKKVTNFVKNNQLQITIVDAWKDQQAEKELLDATGRRTVPCLRMGDTWMHESDDIIAKINDWAAQN